MKIFDDLDLHVIGISLFLALPALIAAPTDSGVLLGNIFLALAVLVPQGRIITKSGDYAGERRKHFVLLHELILIIIALVTLCIWGLESLLEIR